MTSRRSSLTFLVVIAASSLLFAACGERQLLGPSPLPQNQRSATSVTVRTEYEGAATRMTVPAASSLSVTIVPGAEVYRVGQTARFAITILKDGQPLEGSSSTVTATFPLPTQPVVLTEVAPGAFTFDALLAAAGQATLTVNVLHDYAGAVEASERNIARIETELTELRAALAGTTDDKERRVLEVKIANRESTLALLREWLATMQTPQVSNASTITVLPSDSTPPVFGRRWPPASNGATWIRDALTPVEVEVSDTGSGVDHVELKLNEGSPIGMVYDAALQRYRYQPTQPWPEGISQSVLFMARDRAGNEATETFFFTADYTAPRVVSFSPAETNDPTPLITVVLTDDLAGLRVSGMRLALDGQLVPFTWTFSERLLTLNYQVLTPLFPGMHQVEVSVTDHAGNVLNTTLWVIVR
jgi:hypothetical protein